MRVPHMLIGLGITLGMVAASAMACGGGGGGGGGTPTSPSPSPGGVTTITLTSAGVSTQTVRIDVGQQVRFVNNASRSVDVASDPHLVHNMCPPLNLGMMASGQEKTATLPQRGTCTYHDHLNPEDARFRGTILVGVSEPGPGPDYRTVQ